MEIDEEKELMKIAENYLQKNSSDTSLTSGTVDNVKGEIIAKAAEKMNNENAINKNAKKLAEIAEQGITNDLDKCEVENERVAAQNRADRQDIRNRLYELKTKAKELKRERLHKLKMQRLLHKKEMKEQQWEMYKGRLQTKGYDYLPNRFVLKMILAFDGLIAFLNGLEKTSTAILKALKWIFVLGAILIVIFAIPVTREWILSLLGFI